VTGRDHDSLVQRQFSANAEHYRTSATHARGESLLKLVALLQPQPHWLALDVATGAGHTAATLAPHVDTVIAGDITAEMLAQAELVCREQRSSNVLFIRESADALSCADNVFDLVTCRVAAHHFPEPEAFVGECARALKPDGILAVIDNIVPDDRPSADWINDFERRRDPSHARCLSLAQWHETFVRTGFAIVCSEVNSKWFDFEEWMRRMNVDHETIALMERQLRESPDLVRRFWQPARENDRTRLALQEAILIGRV
jgi:ubiquinone/menaquinone biosynthesis C-methylase UbiE